MKFKKIHLYVIVVIFLFVVWLQPDLIYVLRSKPYEKVPNMTYVLQWTSAKTEPFVFMGQGQETFIKKDCSVRNCFITSNKNLLNDITEFDVVLFHGPEINKFKDKIYLPKKRESHQNYIFVSMESSAIYPVDYRLDDFFNLTWTYKLKSDIYFGYLLVKDEDGKVIGPKIDMNWMDIRDMLPVNEKTKMKLENKTIAAAWFVSNCKAPSGRSSLGTLLTKELNSYNMSVDIYGRCGNKTCPRNSKECLKMLQRDYYFYFAFENSFDQDYVTEKLLYGLQNYAVPVVYGGANYTRFMPKGIYLDALDMTVEELAREMVAIISDKERYQDFFKWHNHYSYHRVEESSETDYYCKFCAFINMPEFKNRSTTIEELSVWWNPNGVKLKKK